MKLKDLLESKDYYIAYDITDPEGRNIYKTGYQQKSRFENARDAKNSFGRENEDITTMKLSAFNKKFKTNYK